MCSANYALFCECYLLVMCSLAKFISATSTALE